MLARTGGTDPRRISVHRLKTTVRPENGSIRQKPLSRWPRMRKLTGDATSYGSFRSMPRILKFDFPRFYRALNERRALRGASWRQVAREVGIGKSTLARM